jgi:hypothetical protein
MLAPQTLITATLVTIAEPDPIGSHEWLERYLECSVCGECFADASPAYTIGEYPPAYLHTSCI